MIHKTLHRKLMIELLYKTVDQSEASISDWYYMCSSFPVMFNTKHTHT